MKRFVNGDEVDLSDDFEIRELPDRLIIRTPEGSFSAVAIRHGDAILVSYKGAQYRIERTRPASRSVAEAANSGELRAPMSGVIVEVHGLAGAEVTAGQVMLVLEAMKTQQPMRAPFDGVLKAVEVAKGDQVAEGQLLALVEVTSKPTAGAT